MCFRIALITSILLWKLCFNWFSFLNGNTYPILVIPVCIGWIPSRDGSNKVAYCSKKGGVQVWNIKDDKIVQVDHTSGFDQEITLFRWHHADSSKFVFGHIDGSLSLHISGSFVSIL